MAEELYDYGRQAWIRGGAYVRCGHPETMACGCYGREHAGEPVDPDRLAELRAMTGLEESLLAGDA